MLNIILIVCIALFFVAIVVCSIRQCKTEKGYSRLNVNIGMLRDLGIIDIYYDVDLKKYSFKKHTVEDKQL